MKNVLGIFAPSLPKIVVFILILAILGFPVIKEVCPWAVRSGEPACTTIISIWSPMVNLLYSIFVKGIIIIIMEAPRISYSFSPLVFPYLAIVYVLVSISFYFFEKFKTGARR